VLAYGPSLTARPEREDNTTYDDDDDDKVLASIAEHGYTESLHLKVRFLIV
jgi:hypothetical protein